MSERKLKGQYEIHSEWLVQATSQEVFEILCDPTTLPQWWPSVYRSARSMGDFYRLNTQGWLPYQLVWNLQHVSIRPGAEIAVETWGDLEGRGAWTFTDEPGGKCTVRFSAAVDIYKPILRWFSPWLAGALAANQRWGMRMGLISLQLELQRRRGVPAGPPPAAINWPRWPLLMVGALAWMMRRARRR